MKNDGLISLVLVTIIYSTFIAPNLQKLGRIRQKIADIKFPLKSEDQYEDELKSKGAELSAKLTQYQNVHSELKQFLKYFYYIIGILLTIQVIMMIRSRALYFADTLAVISLLLIVLSLHLSLRSYMKQPWKISSTSWLAGSANIAPVHLNKLFNAQLSINHTVRNAKYEDDTQRISIVSDMDFLGYRYIMIIESIDGNRLYYISAGKLTSKSEGSFLVSPNGSRRIDMRIGSVKLKPNKYRLRLILFNAPFQGLYKAPETTFNFEVPETGLTPKTEEKLLVDAVKGHYEYSSLKGKIKNINYQEGFENDASIISLVSNKNFLRMFEKNDYQFIVTSLNGDLRDSKISKYCSRRNATKQKMLKLFHRKKNRTAYLKLN